MSTKIVILLIAIFSVFTLVSCGKNNVSEEEQVWGEAEDGTVVDNPITTDSSEEEKRIAEWTITDDSSDIIEDEPIVTNEEDGMFEDSQNHNNNSTSSKGEDE